jgi:periplasmic protein CpxP/Spy
MKKLMIIAIVFSFGISANAQQNSKREMPSPQQRAERMTERMAEKLELTEDQKTQVYAINLKNAEKRQEEMAQRKAEQEVRRQEINKQQDEIKAVLTPDQKAKWEEAKKEGTQQRGNYRKHNSETSRESNHHSGRHGGKSQRFSK